MNVASTTTGTTIPLNNSNNNNGKIASIKYPTPWPNYATDWSPHSSPSVYGSIAVASFRPTLRNSLQVLAMPTAQANSLLVTADDLSFDYVATRLQWSPSLLRGHEFLAVSGDGINLWRRPAGYDPSVPQTFEFTAKLISKSTTLRSSIGSDGGGGGGSGSAVFTTDPTTSMNSSPISSSTPSHASNPPAPLTSFDWNRSDPMLLVTASYDTTCTVWNLETGSIKTQLIAHDKQVFDVSWSPTSPDTFVSVGADGSLRLFDVRSLDHSTILYETPDARPLLRVGWNPVDPNYLAVFAIDSDQVVLMDIRMPSVPAAELVGKSGSSVLSMRWAPHSSGHLLVSDSNRVMLWDLGQSQTTPSWFLANDQVASTPHPIHQMVWPASSPNNLLLSTAESLHILDLGSSSL